MAAAEGLETLALKPTLVRVPRNSGVGSGSGTVRNGNKLHLLSVYDSPALQPFKCERTLGGAVRCQTERKTPFL